MREMNIEKKILSGFKMDALVSISTEEDLRIIEEEQGMRCHGTIYIMGEFIVNDELRQFCEPIELDVYAPFHKLSDDLFHVELKDVNGMIDDGLLITLTLFITGMKEDKEESVVVKQEDEDVTLEFMEDLFEDDHSMIVSKRLIVAKNDDTYESISLRYNVDLNTLRSVNHNKEIIARQLVILP